MRKAEREVGCGKSFRAPGQFRGHVDGFPDARVSSAAAKIASHGIVDVSIGWIGIGSKQGSGAHHLSGLAITTLRNLYLEPCLLHGMRAVCRQAFDGRYARTSDCADRRYARTYSVAVDIGRAGAAKSHAATEFRTGQAELLAQRPKKRRCGIDIQFLWFVVDDQTNRSHAKYPQKPCRTLSFDKTGKIRTEFRTVYDRDALRCD